MPVIVTLCTDFGLEDSYVGAMRGALLSVAPEAVLVDITHNVAPHSVTDGAFVLSAAFDAFPPGTVHLAVVDPGVGTARRALAARSKNYFWVAPDNGLLSVVFQRDPVVEVVSLTRPRYWRTPVSSTFNGRDIFAPVAGHLARGVPLRELGEPVDDWIRLREAMPTVLEDGTLKGQVVHIDHFGNVVTNIPGHMLRGQKDWTITVAGFEIDGIKSTYADVREGYLLALVGSHGSVEVAIRDGNAARYVGVRVGNPVTASREG